MKIPAPNESNFERAPEGNHVAVCYRIIDLGTQATQFGDKRQVMFSWELPNELMETGEPFIVNSRRLTLSGNEKGNLRIMLESWRGRAFSKEDFATFTIESVLGKPCLLNIVHETNAETQKTYAVVKAVTPIPKGTQAPAAHNPITFFSLDEFEIDVFESLPDYYKDLIATTPEYVTAIGGKVSKRPEVATARVTVPNDPSGSDDEIPF